MGLKSEKIRTTRNIRFNNVKSNGINNEIMQINAFRQNQHIISKINLNFTNSILKDVGLLCRNTKLSNKNINI